MAIAPPITLRTTGLGKLVPLQLEHRPFGIPLAAHRDILPGRHGQRAGEQPGQAGGEDRGGMT
jgi:hypothetical protein